MKTNSLNQLEALGQSIWLDYIKRDLLTSGKLKKLITEDSLCGVTSNPNIFEKAIVESHDYDKAIEKMLGENKEVQQIYETLVIKDIQDAADLFHPIYNESKGEDGYVSLEVNPNLAHDAEATIKEARRLWQELNRPNVLIKVPATKQGLVAIKQLISEGINVNVTLLFGLPRYQEVANAYIAGLEQRLAKGKPLNHLFSVASFFLSRIDVLLDPKFEKYMSENDDKAEFAKKLHGQIAIASAKIAYQKHEEIFNSPRFQKLREKGARPQRLLWASTSTKNPAYSDVKYVEALIGPQTINTLPLETIEDYRDHGRPESRLTREVGQAKEFFRELPRLNIDIDQATQQLEDEGVKKFSEAYDQLISTLEKKLSEYHHKK